MSHFDQMLQELETLAKSYGDADGEQDDKNIQAAAAGGDADADGDGKNDVTGGDTGHAEPDGDENARGEGDGDGDETMGKSFSFQLETGETIEAVDGTELVKSLIGRIDHTEETMAKALGTAINLIGQQGKMIKSLQGEMKKLSGEGRGRKTVLAVTEKPAPGAGANTLAKSEQQGMTGQEFMAKALDAQKSGRLTGLDIARAESALNRGIPVPQDIVARVTQ